MAQAAAIQTPQVNAPAHTTKASFGPMLLPVLLPPLAYYLWLCLDTNAGAFILPTSVAELTHLVALVPAPTFTAAAIFAGWFGFHALMQLYAPGKWVDGMPLKDGRRLQYKMNGSLTFWLTWALIGAGLALGLFPATILADNFGPLLTVVNIFAFALSAWLYWYGKRSPDSEEISGNAVYDFVLGTALNPRTPAGAKGFDWKFFCEARPGLIGWVALDLSLAAKQYQSHGSVSAEMILICLFQAWYVADYYLHEDAILTTWDIRRENFGFMLCWGDFVWVPFTYTIQAYYLVNRTQALPWYGLIGITVLNFAGYVIFRGTNIQKHKFRRDPATLIWGKKAEFIKTSTGSLLLTSGWWGFARHLNYLGDLMMGLAWCLLTGFDHLLPYFFIIYFTALLIHRERRDHDACAQKYGKDWDAYCAKVRYRILPGVY